MAPLFFLSDNERDWLFREDARKDRNHVMEMKRGGALVRQEWGLEHELHQTDRPLHFTWWGHCNINLLGFSAPANAIPFSLRRVVTNRSGGSDEELASRLPSYLRIDSSEIKLGVKIGFGASADIHRCQWEHYDYAVNIFNTVGAGEGRVALRKEVQNLIELPRRHPNIVDLVGFCVLEPDQRPMVLMELLDCDLMTVIRTGGYEVKSVFKMSRLAQGLGWHLPKKLSPFPIEVAVDFICQIATGMAFLHRRRIFHGHLKALNVLVKKHKESNQLKISDFGVSEKLIRKRHHTGSDSDCSSFDSANAGTPRWMAPEVYGVPGYAITKPYSMKADVYSFSMTCVEILTRDIPFSEHESTGKTFRDHVKGGGRPELPTEGVPEDLRQLIARCWDAKPLRRPEFSEICRRMQALKERYPLSAR